MTVTRDDLEPLDKQELIEMVLRLVARVAEQEARVASLEARLNQSSKNSSRPPSSDPPFRKMTLRKPRSGKASGGQPGHEGYGLKRVESPDEVQCHCPESCSHCGESLNGIDAVPAGDWQVFDLPADIKICVTLHRRLSRKCPACAQRTAGSLPAWLSEQTPCQWGPICRTIGVYLMEQQHLPFERAQAVFNDLFGMAPSEGTLHNWLKEAYATLEPVEEAIAEAVVQSDVVGADETTARGAGWLHCLVNDSYTWYGCHPKRGREAMESFGLLPRFRGLLMTDCLGSYAIYGGRRSLCNAHLLRELVAVSESGHRWADKMIHLLLAAKQRVAEAAHAETVCDDRRPLARGALHGIHRWFGRITSLAAQENSLRPIKQSRSLLSRLNERRDEYLRFATTIGAWFDNNRSENALRMMKLHQKISGCFRSELGCKILCRVRGYLSTMRKQGQPLFAALRSVMERSPVLPPLLTQLPT